MFTFSFAKTILGQELSRILIFYYHLCDISVLTVFEEYNFIQSSINEKILFFIL